MPLFHIHVACWRRAGDTELGTGTVHFAAPLQRDGVFRATRSYGVDVVLGQRRRRRPDSADAGGGDIRQHAARSSASRAFVHAPRLPPRCCTSWRKLKSGNSARGDRGLRYGPEAAHQTAPSSNPPMPYQDAQRRARQRGKRQRRASRSRCRDKHSGAVTLRTVGRARS